MSKKKQRIYILLNIKNINGVRSSRIIVIKAFVVSADSNRKMYNLKTICMCLPIARDLPAIEFLEEIVWRWKNRYRINTYSDQNRSYQVLNSIWFGTIGEQHWTQRWSNGGGYQEERSGIK